MTVTPAERERHDNDDAKSSRLARAKHGRPSKLPSARGRPTMGWRALIANLVETIGRPGWTPAPSKREQRQRRIAALERDIVELVRSHRNVRIAVLNRKGGAGKTPIAAYISCIIAKVTHEWVSFLDGNPGSSSPGRIMGVHGGESAMWASLRNSNQAIHHRTATVVELQKAIESGAVNHGNDLFNLMQRNHYGVNTLVAHQLPEKGEHLSRKMVESVFSVVSNHSKLTVIDTGNELTAHAQQAIAELATDHVYVAYVPSKDSLPDLKGSMEVMSSEGHVDKVERATVVISGIEAGDTIEAYQQFAGTHPIVPIGIPFDDTLHNSETVNVEGLSLDTYESFLIVIKQILANHRPS